MKIEDWKFNKDKLDKKIKDLKGRKRSNEIVERNKTNVSK